MQSSTVEHLTVPPFMVSTALLSRASPPSCVDVSVSVPLLTVKLPTALITFGLAYFWLSPGPPGPPGPSCGTMTGSSSILCGFVHVTDDLEIFAPDVFAVMLGPCVVFPNTATPSTFRHFPAVPELLRLYVPPIISRLPSIVIQVDESPSIVLSASRYVPPLPVSLIVKFPPLK